MYETRWYHIYMYKYYHEPNIVQLTKETSKAKLNTILDTTEILDYNK